MVQNFSTIGINFNVFNNITFEGFTNITNQTALEFVQSIPQQADYVSGGLYGIVILTAMVIFLTSILTDVSQFGLFRYNSTRALCIALGIAVTFGINMLMVGLITNFIHLNILFTLFVILLIYIIIRNPS